MIDEDLFNKLPIDKKIEIVENSLREDYVFSEMCDMIDEIKPTLEIEAEKRRKAGAKLAPGKEKFKVRDILARCLKVSHGQVEKIEDIKNAVKENPEKFGNIPKKIDNGLSIDYAFQMVQREGYERNPPPPPPKGEYDLIYCDIPWKYDLPLQGAPPYRTMTTEEAMKMKIPAHKNCILFFWVTGPKLEDGFKVINAWEFTFKSMIIWVKQKNEKLQQTTGYYTRGAHEILFIAIKGSPGTPAERNRPPSVVFAPRTTHSKKPEIFYEIIEKMYPHKKNKLEMFARKKRKGWKSWGDEVEDLS